MDDASSTEAKSASNAKRRADPVRVCIGIPTFKRPAYLKLLLRSLEKQQTQAAISIVVADNDPKGGEGIAACTALIAEGYNHTLTAVGAPVPGIAATRNMIVQTALQQSGVDYVAMIDDDSWPEPNWIEALLDLREKFQVDVVRAAMRPDFEIAPEPWLARTGYFQSSFTETGRVDQIHAGGNFLARAEVFRAVESPWFSPDFALTGGEDDDFFLRLKELGYTFAQSMESTVHERMPAARCSAGWLKQRALMNGTSWANIRMRRRPRGWTPALEMTKIAAGFAGGLATLCVFFWSRHRAFRGIYQIYRAVGKIRGLRNKQRQYYNLPSN